MSNNRWLLKTFVNSDDINKADELGVSPEVIAILRQRGTTELLEIEEFLHPELVLPNPFSFKEMDRAVKLLAEILVKQEKILIYGDYDADGVSATALMIKGLQNLGFKQVDYFIPDRFEQGYGLNETAIKGIAQKDYRLILTVDCGISSLAEAELIEELGLELIITDHHQPLPELPRAAAIINPHVPGETYPFLDLAGVGVAFELIRALSISLEQEEILEDLLPFVALGTIGDVMPLVSFNRLLVKMGLEKINENKIPGIKALLDKAGLKRISSANQIAFQVVPKINASGRMANAERALKALLALPEEADAYAAELEFLNKERKDKEQVVYQEALEILDTEDLNQGGFVLFKPEWHQGVLGIVASRISELVEKPVFILTAENDQIKGSGRAPEGFDLHAMLQALEGYLERFGGHAQAAGISLQSDKLEAFKQEFSELCTLSGLSQVKQLEIDLDIDIDTDLNSLYNNFKILEPMGQGNEEPVLIIRSAQILQTKAISSGAHLQVNFLFGNRRYQAFAWRQGHFLQDFLGLLDLVIKLQTNVYRGVESLRIEILDWRQATLLNLSQLQEIRERGDSSSFYFYSPESLEILNESGIMGKDDLQLAINQEFPFLPLGQYWPSSENLEVYQLDLPLSTEVSGQSLFDQSQVLNFKQMLNWLLPDREHLAIWYRWLKGEGLNLKAYDTYLYPGGLNDFYAEIALSNVLHLFLQAGLIELRENDFFWLETSGKIDLHSLDEFKIMEKKRENLQNLLG